MLCQDAAKSLVELGRSGLKAFFDPSVLVAVCYGDHENHAARMETFLRFTKPDAGCAAHSLVEVDASLTRMPGEHRMTAAQAMLLLDTLDERLTIVTLDAGAYFARSCCDLC